VNAAILAAQIVSGAHPEIRERVRAHREQQSAAVLAKPDPSVS
jgi:phosphoribosylcarboxyaminoimidazole (NCAIR) mutase